MPLLPRRRIRALALAFAASTVVLAGLLVLTWIHLSRLGSTVDSLQRDLSRMKRSEVSTTPAGGHAAQASYALEVEGGGEVFPALAAGAAPEAGPLATLRVTNPSASPIAQTISAEIAGWSLRAEQTLVLAAGETRSVRLEPQLLPRAYENDEPRHATLHVRAAGSSGRTLFDESRRVLIRGGAEICWGPGLANARLSARWVTPHDPAVLELVSQARRFVPRGRLAGYNTSTGTTPVADHVRAQAAAIYRALRRHGLSSVEGPLTIGERSTEPQRIRLPLETLRQSAASSLDVSVAFASAVENLGMQPLLVIVPGHALAGVRLGHNSDEVLYLDLGVLPSGSFDAAVASARSRLQRTAPESVLSVDVAAARALGVYPLVERSTARTMVASSHTAAAPRAERLDDETPPASSPQAAAD